MALSEATTTLIDARERIAMGWVKGAFYRDGAVCALGAFLPNPKTEWMEKRHFFYGERFADEINDVPDYKSIPNIREAINFLYAAIKSKMPDKQFCCSNDERRQTSAISEYNNMSETTHEDILDVFDKAIARSMGK